MMRLKKAKLLIAQPDFAEAPSENSIWLRAAYFPPDCTRLHRRYSQYRLLRRLCYAKNRSLSGRRRSLQKEPKWIRTGIVERKCRRLVLSFEHGRTSTPASSYPDRISPVTMDARSERRKACLSPPPFPERPCSRQIHPLGSCRNQAAPLREKAEATVSIFSAPSCCDP